MTLKLGYTADPVNKLEKTITWPSGMELTGNIKSDCSMIDPVIDVEIGTSTNLSGYNYTYISEFGRYYFIRNIEVISGTIFRIHMHVDVLHTNSTALKACDCIVANNENRFNMYLPDSNYKAYQDDKILINRFPGGFNRNNARFVLTAFCDVSASGPI